MTTKVVAVVAFDNISSFQLSVPCIVFAGLRTQDELKYFNLLTCTAEAKVLRSSDGFGIVTDNNLDGLESADIVVVPTWRDPAEVPPQPLLEALRTAHQRGATLVGLCLGTYVLAATGLLENRPATTHWMWTDDLAQCYPAIQVRPDVLYVDDGDIVTSAGVAAGIDCCLHIFRRYHGTEAATSVARRMVVPPHRQGGQSQYIEQPVRSNTSPDKFSQMLEWVHANLDQPHSIDSLASRFIMSRRTFTRRFHEITGTTVSKWLLHQRLIMAERLLETTAAPIELIAQQAGFGSEVSLRHHFCKTFKITPSRYRKEFRGDKT
jgi:transcriptional regulator GlxA family with amidase domain